VFVFANAPRSKGTRDSGGRATEIVITGTRWRQEVSSTRPSKRAEYDAYFE